MTKIDPDIQQIRANVKDFVDTDFALNPKNILFWDTCSLLNYIRYIYRDPIATTLSYMLSIHDKVVRGEIYSVASEITIHEWNHHIDQEKSKFADDLKRTTKYHSYGIKAINTLCREFTRISEPLDDVRLDDELLRRVKQILNLTYYIKSDEVATAALDRITKVQPPSSRKKQEVKDCAIWETAVNIARVIASKYPTATNKIVFYTVNTSDFGVTGSGRTTFNHNLLREAVTFRMSCSLTIDAAAQELGL